MSNSSLNTILENYRMILSDWLPIGASIAIAIEDTFVYFYAGQENITIPIGTQVPENSVAHTVLTTRKKVDTIMESTLFSTPYYAIGYPIVIDGKNSAIIVVLPQDFVPEDDILTIISGKDEEENYIPILVDEIHYIESLNKKTWIYRGDDQYKTSVPLKEFQTKLPKQFLRIHRSYIVNIYMIAQVSKDFAGNYFVYLKNGINLPVSSSYAPSLKAKLRM